MIVYHGSNKIIEKPVFGAGNPKNDYGLAFYCTESLDLACEWGCSQGVNGYANQYVLDMTGLEVLDLSDQKYNVLNWLAILLENRVFRLESDIAAAGYSFILNNYSIEYKKFDVIKGYRADDSYFSFANAFLNNAISLEKLSEAMKLGMLGEQIALRSEKAFSQLFFQEAIEAEQDIYFPKKYLRDTKARNDFKIIRSKDPFAGTYLNMILNQNGGNIYESL